MSLDHLHSALEAQARQESAFAQLKASIENFDSATSDCREFYLYTVLNSLTAFTEGEVRLLAPLVKDKLGIPQAALIADVVNRKHKLAAIEKESTADRDSVKAEEKTGTAICLDDPESWPEPVKTADLLNEIVATVRRFVVLQPHAAETISLYVLMTWIHEKLRVSPIAGLCSPQMRCGKTTLLSILQSLCRRGLAASNISPATLFRAVEKFNPTLAVDEVDSFLKDNNELRGIINSGHTRETAFVIRTVGDEHEARMFSTWCPKVISLIGDLPSTIRDRSIVINMARKRPNERVSRLRLDRMNEFAETKRKCARWMQDCLNYFDIIDPIIPAGLNDRAADNWTPLLAIADLAGGDWPDKARQAALALSGTENESETVAVQLLNDMRTLFEKHGDRLSTSFIVEYLCKLEERPWVTYNHGKTISPRQLAKLLHPFGIISTTIRTGQEVGKGYKQEDFIESLSRYLPGFAVTTLQANEDAAKHGFLSVTPENDVTDKKDGKSNIHAGCNVVTDKKGETETVITLQPDYWQMEGEL